MQDVLINIGYILMLGAFVVYDILWLRSILISAQLSLLSYGVFTDNFAVAFWNALFVVINTIQVIYLIRQRRPIDLPTDLLDLCENYFKDMRRREFLYFWNMGSIKKVNDKLLIKHGEYQKEVSLLLSGLVEVKNNNIKIAELTRGSFIAEMSFLTGKPASADVYANGTVRYIAWNKKKLKDCQKLKPQLLIKIQNILGKDLAEKVKSSQPQIKI